MVRWHHHGWISKIDHQRFSLVEIEQYPRKSHTYGTNERTNGLESNLRVRALGFWVSVTTVGMRHQPQYVPSSVPVVTALTALSSSTSRSPAVLLCPISDGTAHVCACVLHLRRFVFPSRCTVARFDPPPPPHTHTSLPPSTRHIYGTRLRRVAAAGSSSPR